MKVYELLDSPKKLIKNFFAKDKEGNTVDPRSPNACKWCLVGAIRRCYSSREEPKIRQKLKKRIGDTIILWNYDHSYREIIEVLKELDI